MVIKPPTGFQENIELEKGVYFTKFLAKRGEPQFDRGINRHFNSFIDFSFNLTGNNAEDEEEDQMNLDSKLLEPTNYQNNSLNNDAELVENIRSIRSNAGIDYEPIYRAGTPYDSPSKNKMSLNQYK